MAERRLRGLRRLSYALVLSLAVVGCSDSGDARPRAADAAQAESSAAPSGDATVTGEPTAEETPTDEPSPSEEPTPTAEPPHPVSIEALAQKKYDGRRLRLRQVLARTEAYTRHHVTYRSGDLRISGIMNVPTGKGPFPVLILNHGYIDPAYYVNGQGMMREQDYLAREGYVVLHTDYRNHAQSDDDPKAELRMRLGYTEDVINAVLAVKRSSLRFLDGARVGLVGRSMGGGVTYNALVAQPGLVDAAVVFAPVSSNTVDNFNRWIRGERDELSDQILAKYGSPSENPDFWRGVSPRPYFDRITEPLLIHHGTADESCPIRWSRTTYDKLRRLDKDAQLRIYPGEPHAFIADWPLAMRRTVTFLDKRL